MNTFPFKYECVNALYFDIIFSVRDGGVFTGGGVASTEEYDNNNKDSDADADADALI